MTEPSDAAPAPLPRLRATGLSAPTADDVVRMLRELPDVDGDQVWREVAEATGVPVGALLLGLDQADAVAAALVARPGTERLVGQALTVRAATYRRLAALDDGSVARPYDWARRSMEQLLRNRLQEDGRTARIAGLDLHSPAAQARLDRAAKEAADRLGLPIAAISLVLDGAQQFIGSHGMSDWLAEVRGTPVEWSFCANVVRTGEPYVVPDAADDVLQRSNPLVTRDGVRTYAGVPLRTSDGAVLGACCVLGPAPREFDEAEMEALQALADAVVAEIDAMSGR